MFMTQVARKDLRLVDPNLFLSHLTVINCPKVTPSIENYPKKPPKASLTGRIGLKCLNLCKLNVSHPPSTCPSEEHLSPLVSCFHHRGSALCGLATQEACDQQTSNR